MNIWSKIKIRNAILIVFVDKALRRGSDIGETRIGGKKGVPENLGTGNS